MENKKDNEMETGGGGVVYRGYLWLAGNEGTQQKTETAIPILGYIGTTIRVHSFIPSSPNQRLGMLCHTAGARLMFRIWGSSPKP